MKTLVFGATKEIGRAIARRLVERGDKVCLVGRDPDDLDRSASDLQLRRGMPDSSPTVTCDLPEPDTFSPAINSATASLGGLETVVVTAASFQTQATLETDPDQARELVPLDLANTIGSASTRGSDFSTTVAAPSVRSPRLPGPRTNAGRHLRCGNVRAKIEHLDEPRPQPTGGARPPIPRSRSANDLCEARFRAH